MSFFFLENAKGAVNIFEELPSSPVRMKLYLDQLNKVYTDQGKNVAHLSFMLKNHKVYYYYLISFI